MQTFERIMRIPWEERQARMRAWEHYKLQQVERPRFALRLARYVMGDDYDEEVIPAGVINFVYIGTMAFALVSGALAGYFTFHYVTP